MKTLKLSELIGETISSVRCTYNPSNEYHLQEFHSYLKLGNGLIIDFPIFDEEEFLVLDDENINYFLDCFENAEEISSIAKRKIEGQKIENIFFCYYEDKLEDSKRAYLKLSNGYYITEINYGPPGINVDLLILSESEFQQRIKFLNENVKALF